MPATADGPSPGALVDGINEFAIDLYRRLAGTSGNVLLSPYGIHWCLALVSAGARGGTADELARVLHLPKSGDVHAMAARLRKELLAPGEDDPPPSALSMLLLSAALWAQRGVPVHGAYAALARGSYGADVQEADFSGDPDAAVDAINGWVEATTAGRIRRIATREMLAPDTRLVLATALFFKDAWWSPFSTDDTRDAPFHLTGRAPVPVPTMRQVVAAAYAEDRDCQVVRLGYRRACSMTMFVPRSITGLTDVESGLDARALERWTSALDQDRDVDLRLPRFSFAVTRSITADLAALGLRQVLGPEADLTGILRTPDPLWIDQVLHAARIEVDEEGTEATAATVTLSLTGIPPPRKRVVVDVDRPFAYVIRHDETGAILFMGRVADPRG